jgi:hypothetical protein
MSVQSTIYPELSSLGRRCSCYPLESCSESALPGNVTRLYCGGWSYKNRNIPPLLQKTYKVFFDNLPLNITAFQLIPFLHRLGISCYVIAKIEMIQSSCFQVEFMQEDMVNKALALSKNILFEQNCCWCNSNQSWDVFEEMQRISDLKKNEAQAVGLPGALLTVTLAPSRAQESINTHAHSNVVRGAVLRANQPPATNTSPITDPNADAQNLNASPIAIIQEPFIPSQEPEIRVRQWIDEVTLARA